jgi:hypothetical protein
MPQEGRHAAGKHKKGAFKIPQVKKGAAAAKPTPPRGTVYGKKPGIIGRLFGGK